VFELAGVRQTQYHGAAGDRLAQARSDEADRTPEPDWSVSQRIRQRKSKRTKVKRGRRLSAILRHGGA
jgi:hypothetical protein